METECEMGWAKEQWHCISQGPGPWSLHVFSAGADRVLVLGEIGVACATCDLSASFFQN